MTTKMSEMGRRQMNQTKLQDDKYLRGKYKEFLTFKKEWSENGDKFFYSMDRVYCIGLIANLEGLALQIRNSQDDL